MPGSIIAMIADNGTVYRFRITSGATVTHSGTDGSTIFHACLKNS